MVCWGRPYHFKYVKGCLPHILLGKFLNTLTQIILRYYFVESVYLLQLVRLWHISISGQYLNCKSKKALIKLFLFGKSMYWQPLAGPLTFLLAFLHNTDMWQSQSTYYQNEHLKVSHKYYFGVTFFHYYPFDEKQTIIWHLSGLLFMRLLTIKPFKQIFWRFFQKRYQIIYIFGNIIWCSLIYVNSTY